MAAKLTAFSKFLIASVIVGGGAFGLWYFFNKTDSGKNISDKNSGGGLFSGGGKTIKVGVVTWGGYVGGQYFNNGFKPNAESRYTKEYGIDVEFVLDDNFTTSREAWKSDKVNVLWTTIDAFPTEAAALAEFEPQVIFQADWSRGGDAIVVKRGINTVADLKGKSIAVAQGTPSHTFLLWLLDAGDLKMSDVKVVEVASAIDAATTFKGGQVDAAVVWSPDDEDCVANVPGSKILKNTRTATNIIADVFIVKKKYLEENEEALKALVEGWLKGAAEINSDPAAKEKAAQILSEGTNQPLDFCKIAVNNARLCTFGDNVNFFNLNGNFDGVKGEDLYLKMGAAYENLGLADAKRPSWRQIANPSLIRKIKLEGDIHLAEGGVSFDKPTETAKNTQAFSTKSVSITFPTGSFTLDDNAKQVIELKFLDIAKAFSTARIRIEGNTDNVGNPAANKELSRKRAQAVVDFLVNEHKFSPNRFVIVGNGADKPVASNATEEGRAKNRRTEFQLLE